MEREQFNETMAFLGKTTDYLLHLGANEGTLKTANHLRKNMTEAEKILWNELKNRKVKGLKFRRQHPLHFYIADFYCHEQRLVIEVDGGVHMLEKQKDNDENRTAELERFGIRVIRFTNDQVINSIDEVIQSISRFVQNDPPP
ncbi:MAG: endonuclease domain-containing protein [Bacteroidales bacterium]|nr:endonuclease domain-containing protein [Bacteroidales bacterium]